MAGWCNGNTLGLTLGAIRSIRIPATMILYRGEVIRSATTTLVDYSTFSAVIEAITAQISVAQIVAILASAVGISIAFVFMWWGLRKVTRMVMGSARSGTINP